MNTDKIVLSEQEQRLLAMQQVIGLVMAHLADQDLLNLQIVRNNVDLVADGCNLGDVAMSDIDRIFGAAELALTLFRERS